MQLSNEAANSGLPCIAEDDGLHTGRRMYIYNEVLTTSILVLVYGSAS